MNRPDEQRRQQGANARRSGTRALSTMTAGLAIAGALGVGAVAYSANQTVMAKLAATTTTSTSSTASTATNSSTNNAPSSKASTTSGLTANTTAPAATTTTTTTPVAATHGS